MPSGTSWPGLGWALAEPLVRGRAPRPRLHPPDALLEEANRERGNNIKITLTGPETGPSPHVERILRTLPEWFGIESALVQYVEDAARMPTWYASIEGEVVGFLSVHRHFPETAEVHVVGVLPAHHRSGVGRALQVRVEAWLRAEGVRVLQVKTISASSPDTFYARTRAFYLSMGFVPLEEFPTLWDEHNPCLILVKGLQAAGEPLPRDPGPHVSVGGSE